MESLPKRPDQLLKEALNNLELVLQVTLAEARKCYERALKIDENVYGPCANSLEESLLGLRELFSQTF
ncbi:MAG: hypothetical protein GYA39_02335 [Methanothrix sp.]|nr:hypothetical protein [Methanothrix sp.]